MDLGDGHMPVNCFIRPFFVSLSARFLELHCTGTGRISSSFFMNVVDYYGFEALGSEAMRVEKATISTKGGEVATTPHEAEAMEPSQ